MAEEGEQSRSQPEPDKEQEDGREEEQEGEEYESDPEDQLLPSAMRRREASDDESDGGKGERSLDELRKMDRTSDGESDGEGGAPAYEDDEEYDEEDDLLEEEEELEYEEVEEDGRGGRKIVTEMMGERRGSDGADHGENVDGVVEGENQGEGEKKINEPFAVPTAGAFYMHDDRFRGSRGGRHKSVLPLASNFFCFKFSLMFIYFLQMEFFVSTIHCSEEQKDLFFSQKMDITGLLECLDWGK